MLTVLSMIIFFENHLESLYPFTYYKSPAFRLIGPMNLYEHLRQVDKVYPQVVAWEKPLPLDLIKKSTSSSSLTFVNARLIPFYSHMNMLRTNIKKLKKTQEKEWVIQTSKELIAFQIVFSDYQNSLKTAFKKSSPRVIMVEKEYRFLKELHEVITVSMEILKTETTDYIKLLKTNKKFKQSSRFKNLWQGSRVKIDPSVRFNTNLGPIVINDNVSVGHFSYLEGPLVIGRNSFISPHSFLQHSIIGNNVKAGGEINSSVINDYSNKVHYGFLGNSYVGEWVNIGAGTITSNLKNNYHSVKYVSGQKKKVNSEQTFLGSLMGDFCKIGINSSLSPGIVIGLGASVNGIIEKNIGNFFIYNSHLKSRKSEHIKLSSFIETHRKMFARRNFKPDNDYFEHLKNIYQSSISNIKKD